MKMLHALNISRKRDKESEAADGACSLLKGPFELDKSLSIFKSDSRFILKRLDVATTLGQNPYMELSRCE
jgi:hypothetical protein